MAAGPVSADAMAARGPADAPAALDLHLGELRQIFDSMDPAPFRERDLDPKASEYIVDWARECPAGKPLQLTVHLGQGQIAAGDAATLAEAVREFYLGRAAATRRSLSRLFRTGRISLVIGLAFLAVAISVGEALSTMISRESYAGLLRESLIIGGWVALWRPLEIFLYDWWPVRSQARLYDRLAAMKVSLREAEPERPA
jgi:hypothetical protein